MKNNDMLNQIGSWLKQTEVWTFVGFISVVVGLLCYALSSSFTSLFGKWNFLKIFFYSVFSVLISLIILFASRWPRPKSSMFKGHLAFLVLTMTSIYSFFTDKAANGGKPDAYNLISCAAFAIMSLSLSRLTDCGVEGDLLSFFLACLIVQLMKIKLELVIFGVGFSYFLVRVRSSIAPPQGDVGMLGLCPEVLIDAYELRLKTCIETLQQKSSDLIDKLLERAKEYVEGKYEESAMDHNFMLDLLPSGLINQVQEIVSEQVNARNEDECFRMYNNSRRDFLQECVIKKLLWLNIKKQRNWREFIDMMIDRWVTASVVALKIVFPNERRLCDHVFVGFPSIADECFTEVSHGVALQLLNFANAFVAKSPSGCSKKKKSHSVWRLFKMLKMFKILDDLILDFQSLFHDSLANEAITVKNKLGESISGLFMKMDELIFLIPEAIMPFAAADTLHDLVPDFDSLFPDLFGNEPTMHKLIFHTPEARPDGQHHSMTIQIMQYLSEAFMSRRILEHILREYPEAADNGAGTSSFIAQMQRIIKLFERKLVEMSESFEDPAWGYIFIMNNLRQIEAISNSVFGNDWLRKNREKVRQNLELYHRSSWSKILPLLKLDSIESMASDDAGGFLNKLSLFNEGFEKMFNVQSKWSVYDEKLREQIIASLQSNLLPAYENFIGRFHNVVGKNASEYIEYGKDHIQYGKDHIQDRLNNLFLASK